MTETVKNPGPPAVAPSVNPAKPSRAPVDPGRIAIGTWSGGRFMHFGKPADEERSQALTTPDDRIDTILTADVYGAGQADELLGSAIAGRLREQMCIVGAVGHDFYEGQRNGPK